MLLFLLLSPSLSLLLFFLLFVVVCGSLSLNVEFPLQIVMSCPKIFPPKKNSGEAPGFGTIHFRSVEHRKRWRLSTAADSAVDSRGPTGSCATMLVRPVIPSECWHVDCRYFMVCQFLFLLADVFEDLCILSYKISAFFGVV